MGDDIEVHLNAHSGVLSVSCRGEAFARLRDAVVAQAGLGGAVSGIPAGVRVIVIEAVPALAAARRRARLEDRALLLGCGLLAAAVLFVLAAGVGTIAGWMR